MLLVWMSRSAIPARFSAARTRSMRAAFWLIAAVAVAARVTTPAEILAMSGTRLTSPVTLTSSRVPLMVWTTGTCAGAAAGSAIAARHNDASKADFILGILRLLLMSARVTPLSWLFAEHDGPASSPTGDQPVDQQEDKGTDNRGNEARAIARPVPAQAVPDPTGQEGAGNAKQDGDNAAAWILAGHQQLGKAAGKSADDDPCNP